MSEFASVKTFDKMTRSQAIELCYVLEEQRDKALTEVERLRKVLAFSPTLLAGAGGPQAPSTHLQDIAAGPSVDGTGRPRRTPVRPVHVVPTNI